jgi:endonuclease/exonuclease/phosphatase family metal-dependent hydrolase
MGMALGKHGEMMQASGDGRKAGHIVSVLYTGSRATKFFLSLFSSLYLPLCFFGFALALVFAESAQAYDLKVMTFNIRNGGDRAHWDNRKAQVFNILKNQAPVAAGLQEVYKYQLDELLAALPDYAAVGVGRDDGKTAGEYSPIFYRKADLSVDTSGTYWFSSTPEKAGSIGPGATLPRINTWARFKRKADGHAFYFNSSHWDHISDTARRLSAEMIVKRIAERKYKEDPAIFVCDCNAVPKEKPITYLVAKTGNPVSLTSAYATVHPQDTTLGTMHDFTGTTNGRRIDHVFYTSQVRATAAAILHDHIGSVYPSDHFPLTATLRVQTVTALAGDIGSRRGLKPPRSAWVASNAARPAWAIETGPGRTPADARGRSMRAD